MDIGYFDGLLDYKESDLDSDVHCVSELVSSPLEIEAVGEVLCTENLTDSEVTSAKEEICFTAGKMPCPVPKCNNLKFPSRAKFLRHWNERHVPTCLTYRCSIRDCNITCKRRYDMKTHIREVHREYNVDRVEELASKCKKVVKDNNRFIDLVNFIYKGRTSNSKPVSSSNSIDSPIVLQSTAPSSSLVTPASSALTSVVSSTSSVSPALVSSVVSAVSSSSLSASYSEVISTTPLSEPVLPDRPTIIASINTTTDDPSDPDFNVKIPSNAPSVNSVSGQKLSVPDYLLRNKNSESSVTDTRKVDYTTSFGITATITQDSSCQTTSLEPSPLSLPVIRQTEEELEAHIRWLCVNIDNFSRQRETAVKLLEEIRRDGSKLDQERRMRRELEAENRRLKREILEAKWRDKHLESLFPEQ